MEITVGLVAGFLNAFLLLFQLTLPLLEVIVLVGCLQSKNSAVTWSVASRFMSPQWFRPQEASADSVKVVQVFSGKADGVKSRVVFVAYFGIALTFLSAAAAIVAPVGLGDTIRVDSSIDVKFQYVKDDSIFGEQTPSRDTYRLSRVCARSSLPCPGVNSEDFVLHPVQDQDGLENKTGSVPQYQTYVRQNITDLFRSGFREAGDLTSDPFEIQYRQYAAYPAVKGTGPDAISYPANITGGSVYLGNVAFTGNVEVREGVIVDGVTGGIGFRNHTVPSRSHSRYGVEWAEDLLFMELSTACVDTNWSVVYSSPVLGLDPDNAIIDGDIQFVNLNSPGSQRNQPMPWYNNSEAQSDPQLIERASLAAWLFGKTLSQSFSRLSYKTARIAYEIKEDDLLYPWIAVDILQEGQYGFNLGQLPEFPQPNGTHGSTQNFTTSLMNATGLDAGKIGAMLSDQSSRALIANLSDGIYFADISQFFRLPWSADMSSQAYHRNTVAICGGSGPRDEANSHFIAIQCGYLLPPPRSLLHNISLYDPSQRWTTSFHMCASVPRVTVKEVSFFYNGSGPASLSDLSVTQINPKNYSTPDSMPNWAIERPVKTWNVSDIELLWGMVDPSHGSDDSVFTFQNQHLYLPAMQTPMIEGQPYIGDSMAASRGPGRILQDYVMASDSPGQFMDGTGDPVLLKKWRQLSSSPSKMALIPNLIWTNMAASLFVGTKSIVSAFPSTSSYTINPYERRVTYNIKYGGPAICFVTIWLFWFCVSVFMFVRARVSLRSLKQLLNKLSVGRAITNITHPEMCASDSSTKEWTKTAGRIEIQLDETPNALSGMGSDILLVPRFENEISYDVPSSGARTVDTPYSSSVELGPIKRVA